LLGLTHGNAPRKVWDIRSVAGWTLLQNDHIAHK
jgi:hypothetical protein